MIHFLISLAAMSGAYASDTAPSAGSNVQNKPVAVEKFAGRPSARIAFTRDIRNFQVKREDSDDILYLETQRNRWFRSEISCFGIEDPRDAHAFAAIDPLPGLSRSSRIALVSFNREANTCLMNDLVELTPAEAVELRLVRQRQATKSKDAAGS